MQWNYNLRVELSNDSGSSPGGSYYFFDFLMVIRTGRRREATRPTRLARRVRTRRVALHATRGGARFRDSRRLGFGRETTRRRLALRKT